MTPGGAGKEEEGGSSRLSVRCAEHLLTVQPLTAAAMAMAGLRCRDLILVYHRVRLRRRRPHEIAPTVTIDQLGEQLVALRRSADVVPLHEVLRAPRRSVRPRVAITFDDDDWGHVAHALPVLQQAGVTATFFLSGRALHRLPPYWWCTLEAMIERSGLEQVATALGVRASTPSQLAERIEGTETVQRIADWSRASDQDGGCGEAEIRALTRAGMQIGFHTLHHPVLPLLDDRELPRAVQHGRSKLESAAGAPVRLLAYPHGCADGRVVAAAALAGYAAAFVTGGRAVTPRTNRFRLPRWEPGGASERIVGGSALRLSAGGSSA